MIKNNRSPIEMPKDVRAILFDLDGTLLDSIETLRATFDSFLEINGKEAQAENFESFVGKRIDEVVNILNTKHNLAFSSQDLLKQYNSLLQEKYFLCDPAPNASNLLRTVTSKNIDIALVTSAAAQLVGPILKRLGWEDVFKTIVTGDLVTHTKPSADLYLLALNKISTIASNAVAVEDSIPGVQSAVAANVFTIAICNDESQVENFEKSGAGLIVTDLEELANFIHQQVATACQISPIADDFRVNVLDVSPQINDKLMAKIDSVWRSAVAKNKDLFDGQFLAYISSDDKSISCYKIPYRLFFTQHVDSSLKEDLKITAVAVSGVCRVNGSVLMGKRSASLLQYPGWYELLPSGGLDPRKMKDDGSVDYEAQLISEFIEEAKMNNSFIKNMRPLGLAFNLQADIVDICVEIELSTSSLDVNLNEIQNDEYEKIFWLDLDKTEAFLKKESLVVPTTFALLEKYYSNDLRAVEIDRA